MFSDSFAIFVLAYIDNTYCQNYIKPQRIALWPYKTTNRSELCRQPTQGNRMKNFKNKVAAITGAGSGIGQQ